MTTSQILALLADSNGAVLWWQVPSTLDWQAAVDAGVINFDEDTDCFVHPQARRESDCGYSMN